MRCMGFANRKATWEGLRSRSHPDNTADHHCRTLTVALTYMQEVFVYNLQATVYWEDNWVALSHTQHTVVQRNSHQAVCGRDIGNSEVHHHLQRWRDHYLLCHEHSAWKTCFLRLHTSLIYIVFANEPIQLTTMSQSAGIQACFFNSANKECINRR